MKTASIISVLQKLRLLLTRKEKIQWCTIFAFASFSGLLEIFTAMIIVIFVQILNQPNLGVIYLSKINWLNGLMLSQGRIIFYASLILGLMYLIKNSVAAAEVFYQNFTIQRMNHHFRDKLLQRYAHADYGFYLTRNSALGFQVVGGDVEIMFSTGLMAIAGMVSEGVVSLSLLGMLVYINPYLAFFIIGISVVLGIFMSKGLFPLFYRWGQLIQTANLQSGQNLLQFFHGFKEIVISGQQKKFIENYQQHSYCKSRLQAKQTATNALPRMVIEVLFIGLLIGTIALLCLDHENPTQIMGILSGYLYAGFRLMPGLNRLLGHFGVFKSVIPCIERVYSEYKTMPWQETYLDIPTFEFKHTIELNQVSFRYLNTENDALKTISLTINKGECIGLAGETGSGKSTLVDVLLGLLKPYQGTILIDGQFPVYSHQWHRRIGYVPQVIYLMDDTIEANIVFGQAHIDSKKLTAAIDDAQLATLIANLPQGTKTVVGERGVRLSGGERQRIAIARALYQNPDVLIFDEATSALDTDTESRLMETIYQVSQNKTVIMIAHRLSTLKQCNRILVMEKGEIKQITSYQDFQKKQFNDEVVVK